MTSAAAGDSTQASAARPTLEDVELGSIATKPSSGVGAKKPSSMQPLNIDVKSVRSVQRASQAALAEKFAPPVTRRASAMSRRSLDVGKAALYVATASMTEKKTEATNRRKSQPRLSVARDRKNPLETLTESLDSGGGDAEGDAEGDEKKEAKKLNICEAWVVMFCTALGGGMALSGWFLKLAGWAGVVFSLLLVATTVTMAENALFVTSRINEATCFGDLSGMLPYWVRQVTSWSQILWGMIRVGFLSQLVVAGVNQQLWAPFIGEPHDLKVTGPAKFPVWLFTALLILPTILPAKFSGKVAMFVFGNMNFLATWTVAIFGTLKGVVVMYQGNIPGTQDMTFWNTSGTLKVISLLCASMFQNAVVPQLNQEIMPEKREKAALIVAGGVAATQATILGTLGFTSFFALGNSIGPDGNVFAVYTDKYPDWISSVLQVGFTVLIYLTIPLVALPSKTEFWNQVLAPEGKDGRKVPFDEAPLSAHLGINLGLMAFLAFPMLMGSTAFVSVFSIGGSTLGNWLNMVLPSLVILYAQVFPLRAKGDGWKGFAFQVVWIFALALVNIGYGTYDIHRILTSTE